MQCYNAAMVLHEYPRPIGDTGIGVHWCAGRSAVSRHSLREIWIPELQALGVSWVTFAEPEHALPVAADLLAAGIMPVVRVWHPALGDPAYEADINALLGLGVCYFGLEIALPPGAEMAVGHVAQGLESLLSRGGLPGLPPPDHNASPLWVAALQQAGYTTLLEGPLWQALRNFGSNRPLTYPYDLGHREGTPLTQAYYAALAQEAWAGDAWNGRNLETINRLRREAAIGHLSASLPAPHLHWLQYTTVDEQIRAVLGHSLPILSTAGGWIVGSADDPRYPAVTPLLHMAHTLEACRMMMGTSQRYAPAPDYYFCTGFWLLASAVLESDPAVPEQQTWYSPHWPQNALPIVAALKRETKRERHPDWPTRPMQSAGVAVQEAIPAPSERSAHSVVSGQVRGGAEARLWLVRADGMVYRTLAQIDGRYRFIHLAAGRYTLWVDAPAGSRRERIDLDGHNEVEVSLAVDGWGYEVHDLDESRATLLRCRVESSAVTEAGTLAVRVRRTDDLGGQGRVVSMARRADGVATCEILPLARGEYRAEVLGITNASGDPQTLEAVLDVRGPVQLTFVYSRPYERGFLRYSQIYGQVRDRETRLLLVDGQGRQWYAEPDETGSYAFENLPPGLYTLAVAGEEPRVVCNRIGLDGKNQVQIDLGHFADSQS